MRNLSFALLVASAGCHRATPAEVGAHDQAQAQSAATIMAAERASAASPQAVPAAAHGAPVAQVPER